ncbi:MAG: MBL fold metallo-hydrolase [Methanothrix sp.]|jgi:metallo-beta-lactamase family protein|nr:MBL fold metallo-hydrolase [Methanothrix sp.]MDH7597841.1 MBL fold metallo-hydrolase [Methanothrix sp.]HOK58364.1 MBL fold metallo-hydrolase [Methanothrix sp.]HOL43929.1 MBL fold metallo-hydrolase [Methanothrix sp.]HPO88433.1 MBL fold metallo-hydrolase [Methanothrix sp.]
MNLEFHGAVGGVTGSHMVLDAGGMRVGIDAGLFQGNEASRNQADFGHDPRSIRVLILTHAHIDHSGRVPLLIKKGFSGKIISTAATADLCEIMLRDSAHLMMEAAEHESHQSDQRRRPLAGPLYEEKDVAAAMRHFTPIRYNKEHDLGRFSIRFMDAGHILGSAMIELSFGKKRLVFSGDLGRPGAPFLRDPEKVDAADWLVLESTYGDMDHGNIADRGKILLNIILETLERGGNVVIPAFAIGRTQEILYELNPYAEKGVLSGVSCFVDSPMAISATEIYARHPECFDEETLSLLRSGDSPLEFPGIQYTRSQDESKAIYDHRGPRIIISASGMCTGGRVLHHLIKNLEQKDSTILFVGYQADGTIGRRLLDGARKIRILDKDLDVKAQITSMDAFSAHAGRKEILSWLRSFRQFPDKVFLNHGEPRATRALAEAIRTEFDSEVTIPEMGQKYLLS